MRTKSFNVLEFLLHSAYKLNLCFCRFYFASGVFFAPESRLEISLKYAWGKSRDLELLRSCFIDLISASDYVLKFVWIIACYSRVLYMLHINFKVTSVLAIALYLLKKCLWLLQKIGDSFISTWNELIFCFSWKTQNFTKILKFA